MSATPRTRRTLAVGVAVLGLLAGGTGTASAAQDWAPASDATIHPGIQTFTDGGGQCTANFVFTDDNTNDIYIGQAAHCGGLGGSTSTGGCGTGSVPLGTNVDIGGSQPGTLAYVSWLTMDDVNETDADACAYNDFALIRVHPDDHDLINPSLPDFGAPNGVNRANVGTFEQVHTWGNSGTRAGLELLSPTTGYTITGDGGNGWTHTIYTARPGVPGDSGSAVIDSEGQGLGILVTLAIAPLAGSNGVTDLGRALDYMEANGGPQVTLANGTEPFTPTLLPLGPF